MWTIVESVPSVVIVLSFGLALRSYLKVCGAWLWAALTLVLVVAILAAVGTALSLGHYDSFSDPYWQRLAEWFPPFDFVSEAVQAVFRWLHGYS